MTILLITNKNTLFILSPLTSDFGQLVFLYRRNAYFYNTPTPMTILNSGFDILFNHATQGILLTDEAGTIQAANPFLLQLSSYTQPELHGRHINHLLKTHHNKESVLVDKNGGIIPVDINNTPYPTPGRLQQIWFITNISAQKALAEKTAAMLQLQYEHKLEAHIIAGKETAFKRVGYFLNSIWTNLDVILIVTDQQGHIRFFNPAAVRMLGYPAREVTDICSLLLFHDKQELEERTDMFSTELEQPILPGIETLTIKAQLNLPNEHEWTYIRKDGSSFPVILTVSAIRDGSRITGYIAVGLDISVRRNSEAELRQALDKEKQLNTLKSRFISIASHEFRTPLSTVLSSTYLLEKYVTTADQPKREVHIQRISSAVSMLTDILDDFLSLGKIEEGKIQVRNSAIDTHKFISKILTEVEGLKKEHQQIQYTHQGLPQSTLDANLLRHILMNLVSNALKFSPDNGTVQVFTQSATDQLTLTVKDNGIGITPEDKQHLFERFFRGSNVDNIQGTGLGLHIVAKYAEIMRGRITCDSEAGKGTAFTVTIPTPKTN